MIEISNITKQFYTLVALDDVSLKIKQGEVVGLLGPNGAGKTTLLKIIAGLLNSDSGQVTPAGNAWPAIGYKPERLLFPNQMRVAQYLEMVAGLSNLGNGRVKQVVSRSLEQVGLLSAANKKIKNCSKGMRQRLGLAQVLIGDPPLLLLDEPSNGLDPEGQRDILRIIQRLHTGGKTILISSHHLHEITQICTQLVILNKGKIHYQNSMNQALAMQPHVVIQTDRPLDPMADLLTSLHPQVNVRGNKLILNNDAMAMRRSALAILLNTGYDVLYVEQKRITLEEIYAKAVQ